jgi:predicted nucleic acid-binding protein
MPKTIISDTSCFIILTNIGELDLLHKVYGQILTTIDIAIEVTLDLTIKDICRPPFTLLGFFWNQQLPQGLRRPEDSRFLQGWHKRFTEQL